MGNGNIDVGNQTPTREPGDTSGLARGDGRSELRIGGENPPKAKWPRVSGAMSLQRGDIARGNESAPQKFVQLVGYRDPEARRLPWVRIQPAPVKS